MKLKPLVVVGIGIYFFGLCESTQANPFDPSQSESSNHATPDSQQKLLKLEELWNEPEDPALIQAAEVLFEDLKSSPLSKIQAKVEAQVQDEDKIYLTSSLYEEQFRTSQTLRYPSSNNCREKYPELGWFNAVKYLDQLTPGEIQAMDPLEFTQTVHKILYYGTVHRDLSTREAFYPGSFRNTESWAGPSPQPGETSELMFLPKSELQQALTRFNQWLVESMRVADAGQMNPIVLAGRAFQRFLSIHPFCNGNGRTARLLLNFILKRYRLPQVALKGELALFSDLPADQNKTTSDVLHLLIQAIRDSYEFTKRFAQFENKRIFGPWMYKDTQGKFIALIHLSFGHIDIRLDLFHNGLLHIGSKFSRYPISIREINGSRVQIHLLEPFAVSANLVENPEQKSILDLTHTEFIEVEFSSDQNHPKVTLSSGETWSGFQRPRAEMIHFGLGNWIYEDREANSRVHFHLQQNHLKVRLDYVCEDSRAKGIPFSFPVKITGITSQRIQFKLLKPFFIQTTTDETSPRSCKIDLKNEDSFEVDFSFDPSHPRIHFSKQKPWEYGIPTSEAL